MKNETNTLQKACVYSAIMGAGLAIPALIPNIMPIISLFVLPFLSAVIVFGFMNFKKELDIDEMKDYALYGGIIGTVSCFSYLIIFSPLVVLINFFFKNYYAYAINYLNFFLAGVLVAAVALIFFITNTAGGLLIGFLLKQFRQN